MINYANGVLHYNTAGTSTYNEEAKFIPLLRLLPAPQHFGAVSYVTDYVGESHSLVSLVLT